MLDELKTLGSLDQTMVIFSMDHGMNGKGALWEQGTRIATFVRFPPAFSAGSVISGAVSNIDVRRTCTPKVHNRSLCWSLILARSPCAVRPDALRTRGPRRRLPRPLRLRRAEPRDCSR